MTGAQKIVYLISIQYTTMMLVTCIDQYMTLFNLLPLSSNFKSVHQTSFSEELREH